MINCFLVIDDILSTVSYSLTVVVNLKIKSVQSFKYPHRDRIYIYIYL
jgi:hypothetical protein